MRKFTQWLICLLVAGLAIPAQACVHSVDSNSELQQADDQLTKIRALQP